jgi:hypothetical protein
MKEIINIHNDIKSKLDYFIINKKIPNILFHGPNGSGKRTLVFNFIDKIYNSKELKQNYVLFVNCAQGKGIKFIRDDLKFFAKTNINSNSGNLFKSIILSNADKLTIDAQSALRRCIELFSHTTRFFIIVENKYKLLKPILSRFSEIYIPLPILNGNQINLHIYNQEPIVDKSLSIIKRNLVDTNDISNNCIELYNLSEKLYNKGISGLDLINYIDSTYKNSEYKFKLLTTISKVKGELHNELTIILFILNLIYFRSDSDLENILFI